MKLTNEHIKSKIKNIKHIVAFPGKMVICVLELENGYIVTGQEACVDTKEFDLEVGKQLAYKNAESKIWELEGYLVQQKMYEREE
jgi:hypothetical protein